MEKRKLIFNALVGLTLIVLGTAVSAQASVGTALIALGVALIALAALTKSAAYYAATQKNIAVPTAINHQAKQA